MKYIIKFICLFIPRSSLRKKFRRWANSYGPPKQVKESEMAHRYLDGLNGIEIGASRQNSFGLEKTGAYANVDFDTVQGGEWQSNKFEPTQVNIVSYGDDLPFKDESLDYVLSSHVIEHFFDPIKAMKEWLRVTKKGGYVFIICPHIDRTPDKFRDLTSLDELLKRHTGEYKIEDYAINQNYLPDSANKGYLAGLDASQLGDGEPHLLIKDGSIPEGYERYEEDDHHHWTTWRTESFLKMCEKLSFNVADYQDVDDKVGNGFTIVIKKS